jgi:hypothetical protein
MTLCATLMALAATAYLVAQRKAKLMNLRCSSSSCRGHNECAVGGAQERSVDGAINGAVVAGPFGAVAGGVVG